MDPHRREDLIQRYYADVATSNKTLIGAVESAMRSMETPVVLDAGCGTDGELVKRFSELGDVYGADLDCKTEGKLYCADLGKLPFEDNKFDLIYSRPSSNTWKA